MISEKKILESYKRITENHPKEFSTWRDLVKYLIETNPNQSEQRAYGEDYDEYCKLFLR